MCIRCCGIEEGNREWAIGNGEERKGPSIRCADTSPVRTGEENSRSCLRG